RSAHLLTPISHVSPRAPLFPYTTLFRSEPAHATEFREWLREGAHGEMHYMQRGEEKRCDPQKVLPGARSIVVVAMNYFQGEQPRDRKSTRLNSSHQIISYAVFCLKKKST